MKSNPRLIAIYLLAFLFMSLGMIANDTPKKDLVLNNEIISRLKNKKAKEHRFVTRLKAQVSKFFNPPTYIKFVLKNKKGPYLNIKIGYIN